MSNFFSLIFAMAFGLFLGTLPGVREKTPWADFSFGPSETPTQNVQITTTLPLTLPTPAPASGAWMKQPGRTSLDAPVGPRMDSRGTMGASRTNNNPAGGATMLSR